MAGALTASRREQNVDVVITTHNGWDLTRRCLEHLREQTVEHTVPDPWLEGRATGATPTDPAGVVDQRIGLIESLRLRWHAR